MSTMASKVVIYSTKSCPYCVRAKAFFVEQKIPFEEIDLTEKPDELARLKHRTGHMTVPQIFVDDILIGGYTDMIAKFESGKLSFKK